jgi:HTH-type transcriptional regulator/antitoxin HigA
MDEPVIGNDGELTAALRDIDTLWRAEPGSPDGDKLDSLVALVSAYEDQHFAIPKVN